MQKTWMLAFVVLVLVNTTCVLGWMGCDPWREGGDCHAFCSCKGDMTCEAIVQKCRKPGQSGDSCHATRPCASGLSCQPGVHKCYHNPRKLYEPCTAGHPCRSGLSCAPGVLKCYHVPRRIGEPCLIGDCDAGLHCREYVQKCSDGH